MLTASHCFGFTGQPTYVRVGDTDLVSSAGRLSQLQLKREKKDLKNCFVKKNIEKINKLIKSDYQSLKEKSSDIPDFL